MSYRPSARLESLTGRLVPPAAVAGMGVMFALIWRLNIWAATFLDQQPHGTDALEADQRAARLD